MNRKEMMLEIKKIQLENILQDCKNHISRSGFHAEERGIIDIGVTKELLKNINKVLKENK